MMNRIICCVLCLAFLGLSLLHTGGCGSEPECKFDGDCVGAQRRCKEGKCVRTEAFQTDVRPNLDEPNKECQSGHSRTCYTSATITQNVGTCKSGTQLCQEDGTWGKCEEEVTPVEEKCDNEDDDDCDGLINEGCKCTDKGKTRPCYNGPPGTDQNLPCLPGKQRCGDDGTWSDRCEGFALPQKEICDGLDNDCDGQIDNDCPCVAGKTRPCYTSFTETSGKGLCKEGVMTCRDNLRWGTCEGAVGPKAESCNGEDDDCNGKVDEGCECLPGESIVCYTGPTGTLGKGACDKGRKACDETGGWGPCLGETNPITETCNGVDDDCDGQVDEDLKRPPCDLQKGICGGASRRCGGTSGWLACTPLTYLANAPNYEENESKCDNIDNDCDGVVDESLIRPCYTGTKGCAASGKSYICEGNCKAGIQTCNAGHWSTCGGELTPTVETCNGADDDCDGIIDNGCNCQPGSQQDCYSGPAAAAGVGRCSKGKQTCSTSGQWGQCQGDVLPIKELCNDLDDDCNGKNDDNLTYTCYTGPSGTEGKGPCKKGQILCTNGQTTQCTNQVVPAAEKCDNKIDDDCDGQIDETDGRALRLTGSASQRVDIPHHNDLNLTGSFTIEVWFYLDTLGGRNIGLLVNKHRSGDNANGYHLKIQNEDNTFPQCGFSWWNKDGGNQLLFGRCPLKTWTHAALVYDQASKGYRFYLNGKAVKQGTQEINIAPNQHPLLFGTESNANVDVHFRGQLAAIRLSKAVRYTTGFSPACTFPSESVSLGVWNLDDSTGPSVRDISPHQRHGKIINATWTPGRPCNAATFGGCK